MKGVAADAIDVTPLREAFLASGMSAQALARKLGYGTGYHAGSTVRQRLGMRDVQSHNRAGVPWRGRQRTMRPATAARYARALGLDPIDVPGL